MHKEVDKIGVWTVQGRHADEWRKITRTSTSVFSWPVFLGLYAFFILNSTLTPILMKWFIVSPHPKWAIRFTAGIYHLLQEQAHVSVHTASSTGQTFSSENFTSYLSIAVHNSELVLIGAGLFTLAQYLPRVQNRAGFHVLEYVRSVSVLLFFAFGAVLLVINTVLIPFILASVSYAASIPTYILSLLILVHGVIEYAALSLLITTTIRTWRLTWKPTAEAPVTNYNYVSHKPRVLLGVLFGTYNTIFSPQSIGNRFRTVVRPMHGTAYALFSLVALVFFLAAIIEVYVSPHVGNVLLAHLHG